MKLTIEQNCGVDCLFTDTKFEFNQTTKSHDSHPWMATLDKKANHIYAVNLTNADDSRMPISGSIFRDVTMIYWSPYRDLSSGENEVTERVDYWQPGSVAYLMLVKIATKNIHNPMLGGNEGKFRRLTDEVSEIFHMVDDKLALVMTSNSSGEHECYFYNLMTQQKTILPYGKKCSVIAFEAKSCSLLQDNVIYRPKISVRECLGKSSFDPLLESILKDQLKS